MTDDASGGAVNDFAAEGLLDGLDGEGRAARADLLEQLSEAGFSLDELRRAIDEERLALLPVERVFGGGGDLSQREVAERAGLPLDFLRNQMRAAGLPLGDPDEKTLDDSDVDAAKDLKSFIDAGINEQGIHEVARVIGEGMARTADTVGELVGRSLLRPGDTERDLGLRYAEIARALTPLLGRQLEHVFKRHMLEHVRNEVVGRAELESGVLPGSETVTVCFADLVGFTKLGERLPPEEVGRVAGRLAGLASDAARPPVRLVKTIGDAAMLVSKDTPALVAVALDLVERANNEGEDFPQLRSGLSRGDAVERGGDWYGSPVNLASRVTGVARPGSVLATEEVKQEAADGFRWSVAGRRRLKGVKAPVPLYRARPAGGNGDNDRKG